MISWTVGISQQLYFWWIHCWIALKYWQCHFCSCTLFIELSKMLTCFQSLGHFEQCIVDVCRPAIDYLWRALSFTVLHSINTVKRTQMKHRTNASCMFLSFIFCHSSVYFQLYSCRASRWTISCYVCMSRTSFCSILFLCVRVRVGQCDLQVSQGPFYTRTTHLMQFQGAVRLDTRFRGNNRARPELYVVARCTVLNFFFFFKVSVLNSNHCQERWVVVLTPL